MNEDDDPLTRKVIGAAFAVSGELGHGFLETVYQNALRLELAAAGLAVGTETTFPVFYRGEQVGTYVADLVVANSLIVEVKALDALHPAHGAQLLNYLKASRIPVGLLINFGKPRIDIKRVVLQSTGASSGRSVD